MSYVHGVPLFLFMRVISGEGSAQGFGSSWLVTWTHSKSMEYLSNRLDTVI